MREGGGRGVLCVAGFGDSPPAKFRKKIAEKKFEKK